ncbi:MAG: flavin reductase family protein [Proteobacteria bacterium]|nr:flavin reductase family protein [Pseudomonadota bacterium]
MRADVPLAKAYLLLNHGPVTLVTSASGGRSNVMAASWAMPLDFDPPKVAVVIDRNTLTRELVDASGEFVLNIPPRALAAAVVGVGNASGREVDKWARFGLEPLAAARVGAPLVAGCIAWLECRVLPERAVERTYDLFLAEVVAASADERVFRQGRWHFEDDSLRSLHYVAGGQFFTTGTAHESAPGR